MKFFQVHPFTAKKPLRALVSRACPRLNESLHLLWRSCSTWWWEMWEELLPAPLSSKLRQSHQTGHPTLYLWHVVEDKSGKFQRKDLLWWRTEALGFVCGGRGDSQALYLEGRTTSVGEVQEKTLPAWSKLWENLWCLSPKEQLQKALFMYLSLWAPEHHSYLNFSCHTCPETQPSHWTGQLRVFPSKNAEAVTTFFSKHTREYLLLFA